MRDVVIYPVIIQDQSFKVLSELPLTTKPDLFGIYEFDPETRYRRFITEEQSVYAAITTAKSLPDVENVFVPPNLQPFVDGHVWPTDDYLKMITEEKEATPMHVTIHPCFEENGEVTKLLQDGDVTPNLFTVYKVNQDHGIETALAVHDTMTEAAKYAAALPEGTTIEMTAFGLSLLMAERFLQ